MVVYSYATVFPASGCCWKVRGSKEAGQNLAIAIVSISWLREQLLKKDFKEGNTICVKLAAEMWNFIL